MATRPTPERRILYLRPYRPRRSDTRLFVAVATAAARHGRLVVIGPPEGRPPLVKAWKAARGVTAAFDDVVEYISSDAAGWRRTAHNEIALADCILVLFSPKRSRFPTIRTPRVVHGDYRDHYSSPVLDDSSGLGLLYEMTYLDRLGRLNRTSILCSDHHVPHFQALVRKASLMQGFTSVARNDARRLHFETARLSALDQGLAALANARGVLAISRVQRWFPLPVLAPRMSTVIADTLAEGRRENPNAHKTRLRRATEYVGRSEKPRRLPPDRELKVIRHYDVEDLVWLPARQIIDVAPGDVRDALSAEAAAAGCPDCGAPLERIFFYNHGLTADQRHVLGRCQRCKGPCQLEDDYLY